MADTKQKLGIELELTLDNTKFGDLVKQIEKAFGNINIQGAVEQLEAVEKAAHGAKTGLDFSMLNTSQWKLLEDTAKKYSTVLTKTLQNQADLNKTFADTVNHQRKWAAGFAEVNGKVIPATKAVADEMIRVRDEGTKAFRIRAAELAEEQRKLLEINKAYNAEQAAYTKKLNLLSTLQKKEEAIAAARERADAKELESTLRKIDRENAAYDAQQQRTLKALASYQAQYQSQLNANDRRIPGARNAMYSELGNQFTAGLPKQGLKIYNGDIIPRTYITDINKAEAAAYKFAASLERMEASERKAATTLSAAGRSASEFMTALSKQGFKIFNGEIIPKSYITDIDKAREAAYKLKAVLNNKEFNVLGNSSSQWSKDIATQSKQAEQYLRSLGKQGFQYVNGEVVKLNKSSTILGDIFSGMAKHMIQFYGIQAAIFAVSGEMRTAVTTFTDFNQALHDTAAIANASNAELGKMSEAALQIATHSKFTATEVMKSMKTLAQAGVAATDLPSVARTADMFATGTGSSIEDSTKVLTTAMNVWDITADKSARITNTLTAALNASKLEVSDLSTSFNYLANQSALFDKSLEETTAIIATLANQGMEASTIGTSMSMFLSRLAAPTPKFKNLLKEYGITPDEISPRLHSMAEIVKRFEEAVNTAGQKGVQVEHIFQGLEQRVGRGFATLVEAGSEKLELMQQRITNTNAAAVAWNESMKGFNSQLNILRSELVTTLNAFVGGYGDNFTKLRQGIQDVIVGLRTGEAQLLVFSSVAVAAIGAIWVAFNSHPVGLAITVALGGLVALVKSLGSESRNLASSIDNTTRKVAENAAAYQRKADAMYSVLSLVDKNKTTEEGYLVIQDDNKKKIQELINTYPALFKSLDIKKQKYEDLTTAIRNMNAEQAKTVSTNIAEYNSAAIRLAAAEKVLAEAKASQKASGIDRRGAWLLPGEGSVTDIIRTKRAQSTVDEAKSSLATLRTMLSGSNVETYQDPATGAYLLREVAEVANKVKQKTKVTPFEGTKSTKTQEHMMLSHEISREKYSTSLAAKQADQAVDDRKSDLDYIKDTIKDTKSQTELHQQLLSEADKLLDEREKLELRTEALKETQNFANLYKNYVKYNSDTNMFEFRDKPKDKNAAKDWEMDKEGYNADYSKYYNYVEQTLRWKHYSKKSDTRRDLTDAVSKADTMRPHLQSDYLEKQYDKELGQSLKTLNLEKERAATADDIHRIEESALSTQLHYNDLKLQAYQNDLKMSGLNDETVNAHIRDGVELTAIETKYVNIRDKVVMINDQTAELEIKLNRMANSSAFESFVQGWNKANAAAGTFKDNIATLGENLRNGIADNLSNGLNDVVSALTHNYSESTKSEIRSLNNELNSLYDERADKLEDIAEIENKVNKTPQDVADLQAYKDAVAATNEKIAYQKTLLEQQTSTWYKLKNAVKSALQGIANEIQSFVTKEAVKTFMNYITKVLGGTSLSKDTGLSGSSDLAPVVGENVGHTGGILTPNRGFITAFANGGQVPLNMGTPGQDSVLSYLEPGEIVIRKSSVDKYGVEKLLKLNEGKLPKFAAGGGLGVGGGSKSSGSNEENNVATIQIVNWVDPNSLPQTSDTQILNVINYDINRKGNTYRTIKLALN